MKWILMLMGLLLIPSTSFAKIEKVPVITKDDYFLYVVLNVDYVEEPIQYEMFSYDSTYLKPLFKQVEIEIANEVSKLELDELKHFDFTPLARSASIKYLGLEYLPDHETQILKHKMITIEEHFILMLAMVAGIIAFASFIYFYHN